MSQFCFLSNIVFFLGADLAEILMFHLDTNKKINATKHRSHKQNQWQQTLHCLTYVINNNNPKPESLFLQYAAH